MPRRRLAILLALMLGLAGATAGVAHAAAPEKAPEGYRTVKVKKAGFSIAVPDDWSVLNLTRGDIDDVFEELERESPEIANQLPADAQALVAQNIVLFAIEEGDGDFGANVNVLRVPGGTDDPTIEDIQTQLSGIAPDAVVTETTVGGAPAIKAVFEIAAPAGQAALVQYAMAGEEDGLVFTFTALASDPHTRIFRTMARNIKLLG